MTLFADLMIDSVTLIGERKSQIDSIFVRDFMTIVREGL